MIIMRELDKKAIEAASYRWNHIAKPLHGLGVLEDDIIRIAGMTGSPDICLDRKAVVIMCAKRRHPSALASFPKKGKRSW